MNITHDVTWPGGVPPYNIKWGELRDELDKLYVGGPAAAFLFETEHEAASARASVFHYARMQGAKKRGWNYQTTARETTLYVRKIAIKGGTDAYRRA